MKTGETLTKTHSS